MHKSITVKTKMSEYSIHIKNNIIKELNNFTNLNKRIFILSDSNVAPLYLNEIMSQIEICDHYIIEAGEASKNIDELNNLLCKMSDFDMQRSDTLITLGGGVVTDLGGLAASLYMRGINLINIPTSTLAQIDSSVGGKVAIDYAGIKNLVGAFYQPSLVLIDPLTLDSLANNHYYAGVIEGLKMGITSNKHLVSLINDNNIKDNIEEIIYESLLIKRDIVEADEFDNGLRNILNFGHTLAHALELHYDLIHGHAVLVGMLHSPISSEVKDCLLKFNEEINFKLDYKLSKDLYTYMKNDKKVNEDYINLVEVINVGEGKIKSYPLAYLKELLNE